MAKHFEIDYRPTRKQALFHASKADEVLYGGAAGGGKSKAIVMDAFMRCIRYSGFRSIIFRRTYRELEDSIISEALQSIPKGAGKYNVGRHEFEFENGSLMQFRHCASSSDMYDYSGVEMHALYMDELTSFEQPTYEFLKTRLRAKKSMGIVPVVRCASNPGNIGHGWVKNHFVDAGPYLKPVEHSIHSEALGRAKRFTTQYIPSLAKENPHITDDYIFELERKPEALRRALLGGDWDAFEGQVFTEWKNDPEHYEDGLYTHVINPFQVPANWERYMSFDWGASKPFSVGWWAIAPNDTVFRYKEWYGWDGRTANKGIRLTPKEIARGILERETEEAAEGIVPIRVADPSIFEDTRGESIAEMMADLAQLGMPGKGVIFTRGENARLSGLMQLHERLRFDENGKPSLYVFRTCDQFIRTIPDLPYDQTKVEDVDTDAEDHIFDETKYFLMARPMPVVEIRRPRRRHFDPYDRGDYN